jgi:transposase InsO family protein
MSRQNYYAARRRRCREEVDASFVVELVKAERRLQSRLGARKLRVLLRVAMAKAGVELGRDRFFGVLRDKGLLLDPLPRSPRTTNSRHSLPVFRNLLEGKELTGPDQAWVSDLTYIRTDEGFLYAALITDAWSRKIVGSHIGDSLEAEGCLRALEGALRDLPEGRRPLHHSDRGCQYCCHLYVERCLAAGMAVSMTEELHCYENAKAERVNGILKQEYGLGGVFPTKALTVAAFEQAVVLYNHRRPHQALGYRIPAQVHALAA